MKKKRLVAILLVGALSINSGVSVFGYTDTLDETTITKEIVICDNGDGVYSEVFGRSAGNSIKISEDTQYDNIYLKYTYYYDPSLKMDRIGCSSQRAYIKEIDTDTYLYDSTGGCRVEQKTYPSASYNTTNYASPEAIAYEHYLSGWVERVKGKVYNKTIEFTYPSFSWPSDWPSK